MRSPRTASARAALLLPALLSAAMLAACSGGGSASNSNPTDDGLAVKGELLVGVRAGALGAPGVESLLSTVSDAMESDAKGNFYRIKLRAGLSEDQATALLKSDDIVYVERNFLAYGFGAPADGAAYTASYSAKVRAELQAGWAAYGALTPATNVVLAVLDTGVLATHEDLANKLVASARDFTVTPPVATAVDDNGHGTVLAGIAAAESNSAGVVGVSSWDGTQDPKLVKILPVKVADANNVSNHAAIAAGMNWAVAQGANVVLLSLGSTSPSYTLQKAVQDAYAAGVLVVAAAGNDGTSLMRYPAAYQSNTQRVLSVSSASQADALDTASKANYGAWVNIVAPGAGLSAPGIASDTDYVAGQSGSSLAAAHVAGAAAMLWSAYAPAGAHAAGKLTVDEVRNAVLAGLSSYDRSSSTPIAAAGGRFNLEKAVAAATAIQAGAAGAGLPGSVVFSATSGTGGLALTGTVVLTAEVAAPQVVTLASDSTDLTVPATVTVPKGARSVNFAITTKAVANTKTVTVTATANTVSATGTVDLTSPGVSKVVLQPASVVGGASATATVTLAAAPAADTTVTLTSDDTNSATVPASITIATGKTTGTFTVTSVAVAATKTVKITASSTGGAAYANLVVKPVLDSVVFAPISIKGGATSVVTVKLGAAQTTDTDVTLTWTDAGNALTNGSKVAKVTIPKGKTTATATVTSVAVSAKQTVKVKGTLGTITTPDASLDVNPPSAITTLSFPAAASAMIYWDGTNDGSVTGTVTLDAKAVKDTVVYLSASDPIVALPASVKVANDGDSTVTFKVTPAIASVSTPVVISASLNSDMSAKKTANVTVKPAIASFKLSSSSALGGTNVTGTVTLSAKPPQSVDVALSSDSGRATVPAKVTFTTADLTKTFTVTTTAAAAAADAVISVDPSGAYGAPLTATLAVTAPALSSVSLNPTSAVPGTTVTGTVTLSANAVANTDVTLAATDTTIVPGLTKVTVAMGQKTATFTFTVGDVAAQKAVTITGTLNGVSKTATFTGKTSGTALSFSKSSEFGGTNVTGTVTLTTAAPVGGLVVTLASSDTAVATVPASVTVTAGQKTATFTVTTKGVDNDDTTDISATASTGPAKATFTVKAATDFTLSSPTATISGTGSQTITITLDALAGPGKVAITSISAADTAVADVTSPPTEIAAAAKTVTFDITGVGAGTTTVDVVILGKTHSVAVTVN